MTKKENWKQEIAHKVVKDTPVINRIGEIIEALNLAEEHFKQFAMIEHNIKLAEEISQLKADLHNRKREIGVKKEIIHKLESELQWLKEDELDSLNEGYCTGKKETIEEIRKKLEEMKFNPDSCINCRENLNIRNSFITEWLPKGDSK